MVILILGAFTLSTTAFAGSYYDCDNINEFPMRFAGCKPGYYYEDWQTADDSLGPYEVGECIECPNGYTCAGGFAGPHRQQQGFEPYEYNGGGSTYDCDKGYFPMRFAGCKPGYYYEDWQDADDSLHPDEVGECIECPSGYTCMGGFAGPVIGECEDHTITLNTNSGTFPVVVVVPTEYNTCNLPVYLPTPLRDGYVFAGWYDNEQLTGDAIRTITFGSTGDKTFWAKWDHEYKFTLITTATNSFQFNISAAGTFYVDCGDNGTLTTTGGKKSADNDITNNDTITRLNTNGKTYTCTWNNTAAHTIRFGGSATGYGTSAAILFEVNDFDNIKKISSISGSLGQIFGTVENPINGYSGQPTFNNTFFGASNMTGTDGNYALPQNLFDGIYGIPVNNMFNGTFVGCSSLTGSIPENLFSGISGAPADYMFSGTFQDCKGLTGSIPENLFSGISGAPANYMFYGTFAGCSGLTGSIPENLFSGISGTPADYMFYNTFGGCSGLIGSIPATLFGGISGAPADNMFGGTFASCSGLTGSIPENLFSGISGAPATRMFGYTFYNCFGLTEFGDNTYVPGNFLNSIDDDTSVSGQVGYMFSGTQLDSICPIGTYTNTREQFSDAGKPWCSTCPEGTSSVAGATSVNDCIPASTITFNLNNGYWPAGIMVPENYITENTPISLPVPVRDDYVFAGWYDNEQLTGNAITTIPSGSTGDKVFWAKWTEYKFTLTTTATNSFQFYISAAGTFYVDCGDNGTLTSTANDITNNNAITRSNINGLTYACTWDNTTAHTIRFAGSATGYSTATGFNENAAAIRFNTNAKKISSISGSLGQIFGTIENPSNGYSGQPRFDSTFSGASNMMETDGIYALPQNLFDGIYGAPANYMFHSTFYGCSGLTGSIPPTLFSGISGAPANNMFTYTFSDCSGLTGSIPATLFSGISGAPAKGMFAHTFQGCKGLTGTNIEDLNNSGINYAIPPTLFSGIFGTPADDMFNNTFSGCSGLTGSIPANLFSGISGAPADYMFIQTFYDCKGLTGSIPPDLFSGISGAPADSMFHSTFAYCSSLTGSIPSTLFSDISGAPADWMFSGTFNGCRGLTGSIPENLFSGISGEPAQSMFVFTFVDCSGLTGFGDKTYVPGDFLSSIYDNTTISNQAGSMFKGTQLDSICPIGTYTNTRTQFNDAGKPWCSTCPDGTSSVAGATSVNGCIPASSITFNLNSGYWPAGVIVPENYITENTPFFLPVPVHDDYVFAGWYDNEQLTGDAIRTIPSGSTGDKTFWAKWRSSGYKFTLTTTKTNSFQFNISAAGTFYVDCGDYGTLTSTANDVTNNDTITRSNVTGKTYTCTWDNTTAHTIRFGGFATGYSTATVFNENAAAIRFNISDTDDTNVKKISSISGSLGQIFGTIENPSIGSNQPNFRYTFYNASNMTGTDGIYALPQNLFDGISGAPADYMFYGTFAGCSGLTGSIPENLFSGISGTPAKSMFSYTFRGCSGLTGSIPENLFSGISGAPAYGMFHGTFNRCSGLTGSIPENLFSGISGAPAYGMFYTTFGGCIGLTGTDIEDPDNPDMKYAIPPTLFSGISGKPAQSMFQNTFYDCSGLTGSIPENLFDGISGVPATEMFEATFFGCTGLTGSIPADLFSGISGAPAYGMFDTTFGGCRGLTGTDIDDPNNPGIKYAIPPTLFSGISGAPAGDMFDGTFWGCSGLTGSIPEDLFGHVVNGVYHGIDGTPARQMFSNTFWLCSGLTGSIPENLFGRVVNGVYHGISGTPADGMFFQTFSGCSGLTGSIPPTLFSGISGAPAQSMFAETFRGCRGLNSFGDNTYVPGNFLSGIEESTSVSRQVSDMFIGTQLDKPCPVGTYTSTRTQFNDAGKPWCSTCPDGTSSVAGATNVNDCTPAFSITFNLNSGYWPDGVMVPRNYITENTPISLPVPVHDDYIFAGWYDNEQLTGNPITTIPSGSTGDKVFRAKWEKQEYTITFNLNNSSWPVVAVVPESYSVTDSDITLPVPIRTDYIFGGWYDNEQLTGDAITTITAGSTGDKVFWAKWLCPEGYFAPDNVDNMCFPHVLHIRDELLYMKSEKSTTPSLTIRMGDDTFYANMTTTQTPMTYGSETYLKVRYNGQVYYVCDDTVYVSE